MKASFKYQNYAQSVKSYSTSNFGWTLSENLREMINARASEMQNHTALRYSFHVLF